MTTYLVQVPLVLPLWVRLLRPHDAADRHLARLYHRELASRRVEHANVVLEM